MQREQTQEEKAAERAATKEISTQFLLGDLLKFMMTEIRQLETPFGQLNESDQMWFISRLENRTRNVVRQCVDIIIGKGRPAARATIESVLFKDGIKVTLTMSKSEADRHAIADAQSEVVALVLPNYGEITAGDIPKADKDQSELPIADEHEQHKEPIDVTAHGDDMTSGPGLPSPDTVSPMS